MDLVSFYLPEVIFRPPRSLLLTHGFSSILTPVRDLHTSLITLFDALSKGSTSRVATRSCFGVGAHGGSHQNLCKRRPAGGPHTLPLSWTHPTSSGAPSLPSPHHPLHIILSTSSPDPHPLHTRPGKATDKCTLEWASLKHQGLGTH